MSKVIQFLVLILLISNVSYAEVYKWVDENGKIHFGDKPPAKAKDNIESVEIKSINSIKSLDPATYAPKWDAGMTEEQKQRELRRAKLQTILKPKEKPKMYTMPDGSELPLPTNSEESKAFEEEIKRRAQERFNIPPEHRN
ncbi:MAG: DUF4124 domain-containing protein [Proteobacteria bacterium]|nr:DUF4124 domain-containing protein [Pseudomonadota bacterium]NOG60000.1 DUF4124 domain-containing protein [Pseudomonadota bacterium]